MNARATWALASILALWPAAAWPSCGDIFLQKAESAYSTNTLARINQAYSIAWKPEELVATYPRLSAQYRAALAFAQSKMRDGQPILTIDVPAYREAARLPESIVKMKRFFNAYPYPLKILITVQSPVPLPGAAPDQTYALAKAMTEGDSRFEVVDLGAQRGKGLNVKTGMSRMDTAYGAYMDADLATPLPEIFNAMLVFADQPDAALAIGNRWANRKASSEGRSIVRQALSLGMLAMTRFASVRDVPDTQCGFKFFTRAAIQELFPRQTVSDFAFDVELLVLAQELGLKIADLPVQWSAIDGSTVDPLRDSARMALTMMRIRGIVRRTLSERPPGGPSASEVPPGGASPPRAALAM
jgi:dolichyl-phosphate beta-glucosyltransferase